MNVSYWIYTDETLDSETRALFKEKLQEDIDTLEEELWV